MVSSRSELLGIFQKTATEIVGSMERELKIQLPDESLAVIVTVQDLIELVQKRQGLTEGGRAASGA